MLPAVPHHNWFKNTRKNIYKSVLLDTSYSILTFKYGGKCEKNARTAFFSLIVCAAIGGMFERLKENFNLTYLGLFPLGKSPSGKGMGIKMSRGYIKIIIIKIGIFESFVVEEKHFAENDQYGIFQYKSRYAGQNDLIALTVKMGE